MCIGNRLETLNTEENLLVGPIPDSLGRCESLSEIRMGHNFLNGSMPRDLFGLPKLSYVELQNNRLTGKFSISSRNDSQLRVLDISENMIHGELPSWIWRLPDLQFLNLSHNCLETLDVNLNSQTSQPMLNIVDLHSNQLKGQLSTIPLGFRHRVPRSGYDSMARPLFFFSVSRNKFDGTIPTSLCNAAYLNALDLSHNHLTGTIPKCLIEKSKYLKVMDLGKNNLTGVIPNSFPDFCSLKALVLNGNQLEGELPKSLAKCNTELEVLDVGNNRIQDTFPCYLKNIDTLRVLILRSNQFYGSVNCLDTNTTWSNLQILDLASNHFVGKFSIRYFSSWKAMMGTENKTRSEFEDLQYITPVLTYQITVKSHKL
ncbi:receptor-like protein Cf-9 homolog [Juglans microcarpa x Juglans regia]|uniref:receptor-like protein Cf-9 homolog n=1 Tax=Juglans microcarpa x Juglans regia TaxID=2249226 RepID=UPI001B7DE097|nr:receptor-like protein Cf-9 homolog [Juglans microcarpa x Juglans regia]